MAKGIVGWLYRDIYEDVGGYWLFTTVEPYTCDEREIKKIVYFEVEE
jgi:hypothetical protein